MVLIEKRAYPKNDQIPETEKASIQMDFKDEVFHLLAIDLKWSGGIARDTIIPLGAKYLNNNFIRA